MDPMEAIKATYFQECDELLGDLERGLLSIEAGEGDLETINAVFRAVHSVKGGAGAFGFDALVAFAHVFETALDEMRAGRLAPVPEVVAEMLRSSDVLADLVQAARGGDAVERDRVAARAEALERLVGGGEPPAPEADPAPVADAWGFTPVAFSFDEPEGDPAPWRLSFRPTKAMYAAGHDALLVLMELERLGAVDPEIDLASLPDLADLDPEGAYCAWTVRLPGDASPAAIAEVFDFLSDDCPYTLTREEDAPQAGVSAQTADPRAVETPPAANELGPAEASVDAAAAGKRGAASAEGPTIRVELDRVDRLIDLVGELVINQAVLAQRVAEAGVARSSSVAVGLDELEQLTREIQDSVMAIRAQPVRAVFQRMPRLVREVASATGKKVRLVTEGEGTEVDKTVIERLSDPITHMLRNAIDHGLETPEQRRAAGKPEEGVVRLSALHRSGRIVIEVADDGKGINRPKVRQIAVDKGLISADAELSDDEIDNLIFLPGFSTASSVSNISGRGVGMDVVKRSIQALGGRIAISSQPGQGSTFTLSLPLTLAVLDGMVVSAEGHTLVAPLTAIIESVRPKASDVRPVGVRDSVLAVRGAFVPIIDVGLALGWRAAPIDPSTGVALLVESEVGGRAALVVDEIRGQRQVVIKSLESHYQRVESIAAATILGDGRVALILDVDALIEQHAPPRSAVPTLALAS